MKFKEKEKVLIYTLYDDEKLDRSYEEEQILKEYCKDKGYEVIGIHRQPQYWHYYDTLYDLVKILETKKYKDKGIINRAIFSKIVIYDNAQIFPRTDEMVATATILETRDVKIESIMQGVIGKDLSYKIFIDKNSANKMLNENKKYSHKEDDPFYDCI